MALTRDDWIDAATEALGAGGVDAVAALPLANRLGTTRGSFYWHFRDRADLLEATLARWEGAGPLALLAELEQVEDPRERLARLFRQAVEGGGDGRVLAALHAGADDPVVAGALERSTERRLAFVVRCFTGLGFSPARARRRALTAHAAWTGTALLQHAAPGLVPSGRTVRAHVDDVVEALTAG